MAFVVGSVAGVDMVPTARADSGTDAQQAQQATSPSAAPGGSPTSSPKSAPQGIAVLGVGSARDDAFMLARAVYASRLRPASVNEAQARVLAGESPAANASPELKELAELRAAIGGEDAASRRLLSSLSQQLGVAAMLVVRVEPASPAVGTSTAGPPAPGDASGASAPSAAPSSDTKGTSPTASAAPVAAGSSVARLFLADAGEFDAARYVPDGAHGAAGTSTPASWRSVIVSLERRYAPGTSSTNAVGANTPERGTGLIAGRSAATQPVPTMQPREGESKPFYASPWFWGGLGAAALLGAGFYFASRDSGTDTIHLQMQVPK